MFRTVLFVEIRLTEHDYRKCDNGIIPECVATATILSGRSFRLQQKRQHLLPGQRVGPPLNDPARNRATASQVQRKRR